MKTQDEVKTKNVTIRMSLEEIQHLDECARKSRLCRSEFLRLLANQSCPFTDASKLDEIISISFRMEQILEQLLVCIKDFQSQCAEKGVEDVAESMATFSKSANASLKLARKEYKAAVKLLQNVWHLVDGE